MVRISKALLQESSSGLTNTLSQILVCPLSKRPLRYCEASNSLISDTIGVSFPRAKEEGAAMEREWCSVCLSKVMEGEEARILPCQHEFHKICVEGWFHECQKQKTCPICRFWTRDEDVQKTEVLTEENALYLLTFA